MDSYRNFAEKKSFPSMQNSIRYLLDNYKFWRETIVSWNYSIVTPLVYCGKTIIDNLNLLLYNLELFDLLHVLFLSHANVNQPKLNLFFIASHNFLLFLFILWHLNIIFFLIESLAFLLVKGQSQELISKFD